MKQPSLTIFLLNLVLISSIQATENQVVIQNTETSPSSEQISEEIALDPIITQAINFSNAVGDWFEDLFDKKQHMSFNTHVNKLGKIITAMHIHIIKPFENQKDKDTIVTIAYNLTSILYGRAKKTYDALDKHRNNPGFFKITGALRKIDNTFMSKSEKTKLKDAFKDLIAHVKSDQTLCKKITQLETVVAENSTRTKQKGMWALGLGLRYRLQCS